MRRLGQSETLDRHGVFYTDLVAVGVVDLEKELGGFYAVRVSLFDVTGKLVSKSALFVQTQPKNAKPVRSGTG